MIAWCHVGRGQRCRAVLDRIRIGRMSKFGEFPGRFAPRERQRCGHSSWDRDRERTVRRSVISFGHGWSDRLALDLGCTLMHRRCWAVGRCGLVRLLILSGWQRGRQWAGCGWSGLSPYSHAGAGSSYRLRTKKKGPPEGDPQFFRPLPDDQPMMSKVIVSWSAVSGSKLVSVIESQSPIRSFDCAVSPSWS